MKMPEATVHKYRHTMLRKDNVRGTGKHPVVETESESACMQCLSDSQLWFGVLGPDASHHGATLFRRNGITHAGMELLGLAIPMGQSTPGIMDASSCQQAEPEKNA